MEGPIMRWTLADAGVLPRARPVALHTSPQVRSVTVIECVTSTVRLLEWQK